MKTFDVTFMASGRIFIEAETAEEAISIFEDMPCDSLVEQLSENGIEMSDIQEAD